MIDTAIEQMQQKINLDTYSDYKTKMLNSFNWTDTGNAEALAFLQEDSLRWDHRLERWLSWTGKRWKIDRNGEVYRKMTSAIRDRQRAFIELEDIDKRKAAVKFGMSSENKRRLQNAIDLAKNITPLSNDGENWDSDLFLLGVENGVIDLRTGQLREARPEDQITMNTNITYDPNAKAPRWEKFLDEIFPEHPEIGAFIQRAIGYSLTGDTREQCLFICYGNGANGKSVLFDTLRDVLGDYASHTPFSTFEAKRNQQTNDLAALTNVRFVTASETNDSQRFDEARVKAATGEKVLKVRFLHKEFFEYTPAFKVWLATNHLPNIKGNDDGIWRRMRKIPFNASFKGNKADKTLDQKLSKERAGILAWAVRGCLEWQKSGLQEPNVIVQETLNYRHESNNVLRFIDEKLVKSEMISTKASSLYVAYKGWCKETGEDEVSSVEFGKRMVAAGYERTRKAAGNYYSSIGIQNE